MTRSATDGSSHRLPTRRPRRLESDVALTAVLAEPRPAIARVVSRFDARAAHGACPYRMVDEARGGRWDTSDMRAANWAIFYVRVEDVHAALDQALRLGATAAIPFTDNGGIE